MEGDGVREEKEMYCERVDGRVVGRRRQLRTRHSIPLYTLLVSD